MKRRDYVHVPGLIYCGVVVLVGLAAMNNQNNLLFWLFGLMVAALAISAVLSIFTLMGIRVRRLDPKHGAVGEPLMVRYEVTSRHRLLPVFNVHFEELPTGGPRGWSGLMAPAAAWVMHLGPRETVHGEAVFWPHRRGEARFDRVRVWTTFPFGIIRRSITVSQPQHTLVYPMLHELRQGLLSAVTPQGPVGVRVSQRSGGGDDYYGMREYRPGDSMRHIAWKRVAKLDELVSIERSRPNPPRLRVVLNLACPTTELPAAAGDPAEARRLEEAAISLGASVVHLADLAGFEIGLDVPGMDIPSIPVRRSHWHLAKIMAALAGIDLDGPRERSGAIPQPMHQERAGVVVVHPDRVEVSTGLEEAWHLTARQLPTLAVRPIGWDPNRSRAKSTTDPSEREVAA